MWIPRGGCGTQQVIQLVTRNKDIPVGTALS